MKKGLRSTFLVFGALLTLGKNVFAKDIQVLMNDVEINIPQRCIVEDGQVFVPLRAICEKMGYDVLWDGEERQVRLKKDFKDVVYSIDKNGISVNNIKKKVDVAPRIINDRTYISKDAFDEGLSEKIIWDKSDKVLVQVKDLDSSWLDIVDFQKTYDREDENGYVQARIDIVVPQILDYDNNLAIEGINNYYKEKASKMYDEYMKLMEDDLVQYVGDKEERGYFSNYIVVKNSNDELSIINARWSNRSLYTIECDVFDTTTGEKLETYDVLERMKEEGVDLSKVEKDVMENKLENIASIVNKDLFDVEEGQPFNYDEELEAKRVAMDSCGKYTKFVEKTTLGTDECYVFEKHRDNNGERIAVNRSGERIYKLKKKDGMYYAISKRRVRDEVSDRDALKLVRNILKNDKYATKVYGKMKDNSDGQEYSIIDVEDLDRTVAKKFAVNRKDGSVYIEKKKVKSTLKTNDDGTVCAVGLLKIDTEQTSKETDVETWGSGYKDHGGYMIIREDGTGTYGIGVSAEYEHFKLVNEDGKTYMEITNEEDAEVLPKGTRFWVEIKEDNDTTYLYVHDEDKKDSKPGNKYWKLTESDEMRFEPYGNSSKI